MDENNNGHADKTFQDLADELRRPAPLNIWKDGDPPELQLNTAEFAARIRELYPSVYDDLDDETLTRKVVARYPSYSSMVAPITDPSPVVESTPDPYDQMFSEMRQELPSVDEFMAGRQGDVQEKINISEDT
ncbi:MAG: hypothetical protein H0W99_06835 [Acidobacteria bacterium]|nr:hypothetical protein [Acidobacteriota bacterium]